MVGVVAKGDSESCFTGLEGVLNVKSKSLLLFVIGDALSRFDASDNEDTDALLCRARSVLRKLSRLRRSCLRLVAVTGAAVGWTGDGLYVGGVHIFMYGALIAGLVFISVPVPVFGRCGFARGGVLLRTAIDFARLRPASLFSCLTSLSCLLLRRWTW